MGVCKGDGNIITNCREEFVRKKVRRPKNPAKGGAEWELCSECRRGKMLCT